MRGLLILLLLLNTAFSQTKTYKIGDTISDLQIKGFLNQPDTKLSDLYKDGLLIINFWATWCGPCLKELPVLDSAAKQFKGKLHVLSTTYENQTLVSSFLQKRTDIAVSNLKVLPADVILHKLFRHRIIPHNIWVDAKGIIRHISSSEGINLKNIGDFIQGKPIKIAAKEDVVGFDHNKTFHMRDSSFAYRSILTRYTPGIGGGSSFYTIQKKDGRYINRIFTYTSSINQLYEMAYGQKHFFITDTSRTPIVTNDSTRFFWPSLAPKSMAISKYKTRQEWAAENTYCYELTLPKEVKDSTAFGYMIEDLNRIFGFKTVIKLQPRLSLVIGSAAKKPLLKPSTADSGFVKLESNRLTVQRTNLKSLFMRLNEKFRKLEDMPMDGYFINDSKINYPIDLMIESTEKLTLPLVYQLITEKYKFTFKREKRPQPVLFIYDHGKKLL